MDRTRHEQSEPELAPWWANGDFYLPGLERTGRSAFIPGAADFYRRFFLVRAAAVERELLVTLRMVVADDRFGLARWATHWNLTDRWCLALARDTVCRHAFEPEATGWDFEDKGVFAGFFPSFVKPLVIERFYFDPTQYRREAFKKKVLERVAQAVDDYCDKIEAAALAAGLKRTRFRHTREHFDWLARYQVRNESYASIARNASYRFKGGRQTVRKAVVELADYLSLTLRPSTS